MKTGSQHNLPARLTPARLTPPSLVKTVSSLEEAKRMILAASTPAALLSKVTPTQATEVLADLARPTPICTPLQANEMAGQLVGLCPLDTSLKPDLAVDGLAALFCEYAFEVVATVCHPTRGLPRRQKYGLKISDVEEALVAEVRRRLTLYASAKYVLDSEEARKEAARDAIPPTPAEVERRKRIVEEFKKTWRENADPQGE